MQQEAPTLLTLINKIGILIKNMLQNTYYNEQKLYLCVVKHKKIFFSSY